MLDRMQSDNNQLQKLLETCLIYKTQLNEKITHHYHGNPEQFFTFSKKTVKFTSLSFPERYETQYNPFKRIILSKSFNLQIYAAN